MKSDISNDAYKIDCCIAIIAYNIKEYIEEAILSILRQKTTFSFEIVIGDDLSNDGTKEIIQKYENLYPNIIRPIYNNKNLGLTMNFIQVIESCNSKYVALCDGDDYWTSDDKLERVLKLLEDDSTISGIGHQARKIFNNSNETVLFGEEEDRIYSIEDMLSHRKFHTSSFTFRKEIWSEFGGIPSSISSNERALYPLVASKGKILYLSDCMCVYRVTGTGLTSRVRYSDLVSDLIIPDWLKTRLNLIYYCRFKAFLHQCVYNYGFHPIPLFVALKHYLAFLLFGFAYFPKTLQEWKWGTVFLFRKLNKYPIVWRS